MTNAAARPAPPLKKRYTLDNAATIYPAAATKDWNATFRTAVILRDPVLPAALRQAVADLHDRFPTFYVQLRRGPFCYRLEEVTGEGCVEEERDTPCRPIELNAATKPLFRVLYYQNRIAAEFFHSVTDGTGAMIYIKTLAAHYLELLGCTIRKEHGVLDVDEAPREEELNDAFHTIASREKGLNRREPNAYQFKPAAPEDGTLHLVHGLMPVDAVKALCKAKGVTINEYLTAVYAYAFYRQMDPTAKSKRPIRISVPANLREMFGHATLRNFAMLNNVGIEPRRKDYSFDEILEEITLQLRAGFERESLRRAVCKNVADATMLIARCAPTFLKKPVMKQAFLLYGERKFTSAFSNLGLIRVPAAMEPFVERFEFVIGRTRLNKINATAVSYNGILNVTFSAVTPDTEIQRIFFQTLTKHGVTVQVSSNA